MKIIGIDMSVNSPAIVEFKLDENLDIIEKRYITFSKVKKYEHDNVVYFKKDAFNCDFDQYNFIKEEIDKFIFNSDDPNYVAIEGYAFNTSNSRSIFQIAEITGFIKMMIYNKKIPIRIYDPNSIKMFATNSGTSNKIIMEEYYEKLNCEEKFNLSFLPNVFEKKSGNPKDNIVDAFYIGKLLQTELKLREGFVNLRDLNKDKIRIFNRCTKANPTNILDTPFIQKD